MIQADYASFLASKRIVARPVGFDPGLTNPALKPFQAEAVRWACVRGRSAMFEDCGLGKSIQELEFADQVVRQTGKPCLILAPLAVGKQFEREAEKFGYEGVRYCRSTDQVGSARVVVTNYEILDHFQPESFGGLVLDESSILKSLDGVLRKQITAFAKPILYRLAATATPAPNDLIELTNHAEFLDVMTGKEIIACFFTQDGNSTQKWRLKRHATTDFWRWLATWVTAIRTPSDLGFSDEGYVLPKLNIIEHLADAPIPDGSFLPMEAHTLMERRKARRLSIGDRVAQCAAQVNSEPNEAWIVWCDLNAEAEALTKLIPGSVECRGTDSPELKEAKFEAFLDGSLRVLVTKSTIAGMGLNFQHAARMAFVGLSDSYEQQYQAIRRLYRFGQLRSVNAHLYASEAEGSVMANLKRKEKQARQMFDELVRHMTDAARQTQRDEAAYDPQIEMTIPTWLTSEVMA